MVDVPVVVVAQVPQVHVEMKTVEITQLQPVEQVPYVHVVEKTVEDPQFQIVEKIGDSGVVEFCKRGFSCVSRERLFSRTRFCVSSRRRL